jgi:hypothetical protein
MRSKAKLTIKKIQGRLKHLAIDISRLNSLGEEIEYAEQKIRLLPLSVEELAVLADLQRKQKMEDATIYLYQATLKASIPSITDEQVKGLRNPQLFELVVQAALRLNGFEIKKNLMMTEASKSESQSNLSPEADPSTKQ